MAKAKSPKQGTMKSNTKNTFGPPIPRHTKAPRRIGVKKR